MSDTSQGEGWWLASDGKWYAPQGAAADALPDAAPDAPTEAVQAADPTIAMPAAAAPIPPGPPSAGPPPVAADGEKGKGKIVLAVVAVLALAAAAFAVVALTGGDEAAADVALVPVGSPGRSPFVAPVASLDAKVTSWADKGPPQNVAPKTSAGPGGYQAADGGSAGVFGGLLNESSCDVEQLVTLLNADEARSAAWAGVADVDAADIAGFVDGLTPTNLSADARLVNHGFSGERAVSTEAVLQRGTAVLVDAGGVPRVNCYSGNPLTSASVSADEKFTGDPWPAFEQASVMIINQAPAELSAFQLIELSTGELFRRPVGSTGEADAGPDGPPTGDVVNDGPIEFDTLVEDQLTESRTEAIYTLEVPGSAVLTLTAENQRGSIGSVRMLLSHNGVRFSDFSLAPGANDEAVVVISADGGGSFELAATGGPAAFSFTVGLGSQDDAGSGADAGADLASATPIEPGKFTGQMGGIDTADAYEVDVAPGSAAAFALVSARDSEASIRMIATLDGDRLFDVSVAAGSTEAGSMLLSGTDEGTVLIEITAGGTAGYEFDAEFVAQTDTDAAGDAGDDLATATAVSNPSSLTGEVGERDAADFFSFSAAPTATIEVTSAPTGTASIRAVVTDASGQRVADFSIAPGSTDRAQFNGATGQQFRLQITGGRASYTGSVR